MAQNADSVIVEVEARLDGFNAKLAAGEAKFDGVMNKLETGAGRAEKAVSGSMDKVGKSFDRASQRSRLLGYQIADVGASAASGINPFVILAQQSSQFANALEGTTGIAGKMAAFFSGPWGAALLAAGSVIAILISQHKEEGGAIEDLIAKMKKHADQAARNEQADAVWKTTIQGLTEAVRKQREEQEKSLKTDALVEQVSLRRAKQNVGSLGTQKVDLQKQLVAARVALKDAENAPIGADDGGASAIALATARQRVDQLKRDIASITGTIASAEVAVRRSEGDIAERQASYAGDASIQIKDYYDNLVVMAKRAAEGSDDLTRGLRKQLEQINRNRKAANDAADEAKRGSREANQQSGRQISFDQAASIARGAGLKVNSAYRSTEDQARLFNDPKVNRPGNPVAAPGASAHNGANGKWAIDIQITDGVTPGSIRKLYAAQGVSLSKVLKEKGHFHVEGSRSEAAAQETAAVRAEDKTATQNETFNTAMLGLRTRLTDVLHGRVISEEQQLKIALEDIAQARDRADQAVLDAVQRKAIRSEQGKLLIAANHEVADAQVRAVNSAEELRQSQARAALAIAAGTLDREAIQNDLANAKTGGQRREAALRLLAADLELERLKQQQIIDNTKLGSAERMIAEQALARLNERGAREAANINRDPANLDPAQRYRQDLNKTAGQIDEQVQGAAVDGLKQLNDELGKVIMGTENIGDAFKNMANTIVAQLIRIAIEQAIIKPLADALFGPGTGGSGGGAGSGTGGILASIIGGLFKADGGSVNAGQGYIVGERGPEAFVPGRSGTIIPTDQLARMGGGGNGQGGNVVSLTVNAPGATAETVALIRRELRAAAPTIVAASQRSTMAALTRTRT